MINYTRQWILGPFGFSFFIRKGGIYFDAPVVKWFVFERNFNNNAEFFSSEILTKTRSIDIVLFKYFRFLFLRLVKVK